MRYRSAVATPDDLGGGHTLTAVAGEATADLVYTITPSVASLEPRTVHPGGDVTLTIEGVGWTETANIYTLLLDNGYVGNGCGFNSQGDVTSPGGPSTPDATATYLQLPMLNHLDHLGEALPAFHLAFEVVAPGGPEAGARRAT